MTNIVSLLVLSALIAGVIRLSRWFRNRPVKDPPEGTSYSVYTSMYDVEIRAEDIAVELETISSDHPRYWLDEGDPIWIEAVETAKAKSRDLIDAGYLKSLSEDMQDVVVTLLVDHSGSMRGESILAVASTAKAATEALMAKGVKVELLGFTTAGWKGGFARLEWVEQGKPPYPGRLCALMHIIYKSADEPTLNDAAFAAMLNPGILYENVDGEAIEWAERRLVARPEQKKLLVVISDGAPVDDSTLTQNGNSILWNHLKAVIARIESGDTITLAAIGVNYSVSCYYANSVWTEQLTEIPDVTAKLLEQNL